MSQKVTFVPPLVLRGARSFPGSLSSVDAWWDWSLTTLLDGLYRVGEPGAQVGFPLLAG